MANTTHLTSEQVESILNFARQKIDAAFIMELKQDKHSNNFHVRLKGLNGEIMMHQETTTKQNAEHTAARIINGGLNAKYKDTTNE